MQVVAGQFTIAPVVVAADIVIAMLPGNQVVLAAPPVVLELFTLVLLGLVYVLVVPVVPSLFTLTRLFVGETTLVFALRPVVTR